MNSSQTVLLVEGLTKRFAGVTALEDVSFDLRRGEIHALCGENGAGKSTLIKCLSGVWPYGSYEGGVLVEGRQARFSCIADAEAAGIAVIYQELALVPEMTVAENIFLGNMPTRLGRIDWNAVYSRAQLLLNQHGLNIDPSAPVDQLGVGQQQLVEIAKALSKHSRILLLDEPTAALTETEVDILLGIVTNLRQQGVSCIYISHKLDEVFQIADRITVMRDGKSVASLPAAATGKNEVIRHMVGREIQDYFPRRQSRIHDVCLLEARNLTVADALTQKIVLEDISFSVRGGEVLGIGGLMGAGRTELLMHIFAGQGRRIRGEVLLNGLPFEGHTPAQAIEHGLILLSEDRKRYGLVLEQSVGFNLSLSSLGRISRGALIDANAEFRRNQQFIDSLGIRTPSQDEEVGLLSGGNQQKVVLGKALMTDPRVIFLDEPTRGIDVGAKVEIYELINSLTDEGRAVVLVSSELPELMGMSDRLIVLSAGRIGGEFSRADAAQEDILAAAMAHH